MHEVPFSMGKGEKAKDTKWSWREENFLSYQQPCFFPSLWVEISPKYPVGV